MPDRRVPQAGAIPKGAALVLFVVLGGLYALDSFGNRITGQLRLEVTDVFARPLELLAGPSSFVARFFGDFQSLQTLQEDNRKLRRELADALQWREIAQRLEAQNARLRALNKVTLAPRFDYATAEIIGGSNGQFENSLIINAGRSSDLEIGTVVMDGASVIGRVVAVGAHASIVLLMTDSQSRVPVTVENTKANALIVGDGSAEPRLKFVSEPAALREGLRITTSNHGGVLPKGLPVGQVALAEDGTFTVRLSANVAQLDFVRLVLERADLYVGPDDILVIDRRRSADEGRQASPARE